MYFRLFISIASFWLGILPVCAAPEDPVTASSSFEEAARLEESGLVAIAAERYQLSHSLEARPEALAGMARCFQVLGEAKLARIYYLKYLQMKPEDLEARLRLGDLQVSMGDFRGAFHSYRALSRQHPAQARAGMASALGQRGRHLLEQGETAAALRSFSMASRLDPADPRWKVGSQSRE